MLSFADGNGPVVTAIAQAPGSKQLVISFNSALDPTAAETLSNYSLAGPFGQAGSPSHKVIIRAAIYDPATQTVALVLAGVWNVHWHWRLTVKGAAPGGLSGATDAQLDGSGNGQPGSNYVTRITMKNLACSAGMLPTRALVQATALRAVRAEKSAAHDHAAAHEAAVDHLLAKGLLHVPRHRARH